ncbi:MAG: nitroreductase family protein [Rickettsiales bacterium]|nr:MAG: nitroreductase family protein [Rickettsiales bacterium]
METIKTIHKRRSVRQFDTTKTISDADLQTILHAGMTTPSAMNKQPWEFIVITDDDKKVAIAGFSQYAQMTPESPLSILVCGNTKTAFAGHQVEDCSAAIQNLMLSATALGIGSVWTGIGAEDRARYDNFVSLFELPEHIQPIGLIVFGYPVNDFEERDYFDAKKVHLNKW